MNTPSLLRAPVALVLAAALAPAAGARADAPGPIDPDTGELVSTLPRVTPAGCGLPAAPAGAVVVLHGAHKGAALSSAAISGQDEVTTLTHVDVEPGREPLYLVLSSATPMIWSLRGDTRRVAQVAVVTGAGTPARPAAGVIGAPAAKVSVRHSKNCFRSFSEPASEEASRARTLVAQALGQAPARVSASYAAGAVSLPSGRALERSAGSPAVPPAGLDLGLWRSGLRFHPEGVAQVNPAAVAGARAEAYGVLPGYMGLAQLAARGALRPLGAGEFRIQGPVARYPAGLTGAEAVRFQLAQGVQAPAGSAGHACVVAQASGRVLANPEICALPRQPAYKPPPRP